jgi:DNA-binding response OmpR family regulator
VLLVNSSDSRAMYAEYLRHYDLLVYDVPRPEDAFQHLNGVSPDVVVTDLFFTHTAVDGCAFIRELRAALDAAASIIVVSGYGRIEDREQARQAGADRYLLIPALPSEVLSEIRRALLLRQSGSRLPWNWTETQATVARGRDRRRATS